MPVSIGLRFFEFPSDSEINKKKHTILDLELPQHYLVLQFLNDSTGV